jgi:hypothetical protein
VTLEAAALRLLVPRLTVVLAPDFQCCLMLPEGRTAAEWA